ncbi:MAG: PIG-L family deacetylase, partial [Phycisphaerales bacterium]|nr:PIG-L family deacetylase [Phycisphaerales bacterium]
MANILVVGPHPDDQEAGMGGTVAKLARQGHDVLLLDITNGEPTPHGDPVTRAAEAAEAARILGGERGPLKRYLLGLTNRQVEHALDARHLVASVIRAHQSQIIFTPFFEDAHPDHRAVTRIVEDARFDAKLTKMTFPEPPGLAELLGRSPNQPDSRIYPKWLFYYYATHLRWVANPVFCVDISDTVDTKIAAMEAYVTQFGTPPPPMKNAGLPPRALPGRTVREWVSAVSGYFGSRIGTRHAEPFYTKEPIALASFD